MLENIFIGKRERLSVQGKRKGVEMLAERLIDSEFSGQS